MAIKSFERYEKKFVLNSMQYNKLLNRLMEHMDFDKYCIDNNYYSIYNVYYDTANNDVIRYSTSKPYYKEKLRLRSYSLVRSDKDIVFLELKKKINGVVSKRRAVLSEGEVNAFLNKGIRPITDDYVNNQVLDEIEYYLKHNKVEPKIFISYKRIALIGKENKDFRITFDKEIGSRRHNVNLKCKDTDNSILDNNRYLMEVKILGAVPVWFANLLSEFKIYRTSFSKYGKEFNEFCKNQNIEGQSFHAENNANGGEKRVC